MEAIKNHPWFAEIDWAKLLAKEIEPPFKPMVTSSDDTGNIDDEFTNEQAQETPFEPNELLKNKHTKDLFRKFSYCNDAA